MDAVCDSPIVSRRSELQGDYPMKSLIRSVGLMLLILLGSTAPTSVAFASSHYRVVPSGRVAMFNTAATAQEHCPSDVVVWLNTKTGIWHEKGMRWYGRTRYGAYVCRKEASAAGYRDTENGQ